MPKVQEIFEEQLKKCRVDYFDFYLFHNVCEMNIDAYLDPQYGIHDYLMEQKRRGRIRHLGFSCHGNLPVLKRFLDAYGKDMEFCQLQLNYIDWSLPRTAAKRWSCWIAGIFPSGSWSPCGAAAWPAFPTRRPPPEGHAPPRNPSRPGPSGSCSPFPASP